MTGTELAGSSHITKTVLILLLAVLLAGARLSHAEPSTVRDVAPKPLVALHRARFENIVPAVVAQIVRAVDPLSAPPKLEPKLGTRPAITPYVNKSTAGLTFRF